MNWLQPAIVAMAACMPSMGLGPLQLVCMADHGFPNVIRSDCARFLDSEAETALAMLGWMQGWDVVDWVGHHYFAGYRLDRFVHK